MKQEDLLQKLKDHKPIIVNYGKGTITNEYIKDYATWDKTIGKYRDDTGIWNTDLLIKIAKGEIAGIKLELGGN